MVTGTLPRGRETMSELNKKPVRRVRVSRQRQINIPKDFYEALDISDEALVEFTGKEIVIRPAAYETVDFSADILKDLVAEGYNGEELVQRFMQVKEEIPHALNRMVQEARQNPVITGSLDDYLDTLEDDEENEWS